jgi:tRNA-2-methylthio-N6-dimethylallyladenosine synthase
MTQSKKVFIRTFGCQMNEYDSEKMADVLAAAEGFEKTSDPADADLILFNTCSVREKAQEKVFADLGRMKPLKRARPQLMIGVAGCVASQEGEEIVRRAPYVDLVFGPQTLHRLPQLLEQRRATGRAQVDISFPEIEKFDHLPPARVEGAAAFVSIMEGCSKYCSFCVVPYTRGEEVSRPLADVMREVNHLAACGVKEVTLLGQNVNAYRGTLEDGEAVDFAFLLAQVAKVEGLERIRYTTSHPRDMTDDLIEAHRSIDQLMPFLHLPMQSGADAVLEAMNRRHSADDYRRLVDRLRAARPDLALSSDFIVGFPGETERDFAATLALVEQIGFAQAFSFKYSPRPGTPAAGMHGQVRDAVKSERLARLQSLLTDQARAFNQGTVGRVLPVLLERPGRHPGQQVGRTPYLQAVHLEAPEARLGETVDVLITASHAHSLAGVPAGRGAALRHTQSRGVPACA